MFNQNSRKCNKEKGLSKDYPIKDIETINRIKNYYKELGNNRDLLFFLMSINTGLKFNEIIDLNVKDVKDRDFVVVEHCADRIRKQIPLNDEIKELINIVVAGKKKTDPLFISGKGNRIDRTTVYRNFKEMCEALNLGDISVSSLRKTFGYHYYKKYKDLSFLQWMFNQTTVLATMQYIDVTENINNRFNLEFSL